MSDKPSQPPLQPAAQEPDKKKLDMKMVTKILKTPSESRTQKQCLELLEQIGDLQFFKQYNEDSSTASVPKLCCKYMEIEEFPANEIIFEFGSVGNKFYVVLEGSVGVFVKKAPVQQPATEDTKPKTSTTPHNQQTPAIIDPLADFIKVKVLPEGSSFGELALLNNKPRLATIKCIESTHVATLSKENFNRILKEHEEQKLNKEIDFFSSIPGFCDLNIKQIRFLCLNNKYIETSKNDIVFDVKDPCDSLFVIKSGEFEVFKVVEKQTDQKEEIMKQNILSFSALNKNSNAKVLKSIKIKVLTVGEMIGEESIFKKQEREFKLVCSSHKGVVIKIKAIDFLRKINEEPAVQQAFFKRFSSNYQENEQRVQRRVQQFHEFKNYLIEDRLPVKLRLSIDKMYSNNNLTLEQKKTGISEFRQQAMEFENLEKKSELQTAILSQSALTQRLSQATALSFQNQIQFFKYKRLSLMASDPKGLGAPNAGNQMTGNNSKPTNNLGSQKDLSKRNSQMSQIVPPINLASSLLEIDSENDASASNKGKNNLKEQLLSPKNLHLPSNNPRLSNFSPRNKHQRPLNQEGIDSPSASNQMSPKSTFNVSQHGRQLVKHPMSPYLNPSEVPNNGILRNPQDRAAQAAAKRRHYQTSGSVSADINPVSTYAGGQSTQEITQGSSSTSQFLTNQRIPTNSINSGMNIGSENLPIIEHQNSGDSVEEQHQSEHKRINKRTSIDNSHFKHQFSVDQQQLQEIAGIDPKQREKANSTSQDQFSGKQEGGRSSQQSLKLPSNAQRSQSQVLPKDTLFFNQQNNNNTNSSNPKKYSIYELYDTQGQQQQQYSPELLGGAGLKSQSANSMKMKQNIDYGGEVVFDGSAASLQALRNSKEQFTAFQFNNDKKRSVKVSILKDNFIRDWKKHSDQPYEDAQQQSLIRKIKKITSQGDKFTDYLRQTVHVSVENKNQSPKQNRIGSNTANTKGNHTQHHYESQYQQSKTVTKSDQSPQNVFSLISLPKIQDPSSPIYKLPNNIEPAKRMSQLKNSNHFQQQQKEQQYQNTQPAGNKHSFHPKDPHRQLKKQVLVFNE